MQDCVGVKVAVDVDALGDQIAEMSVHLDAAMHKRGEFIGEAEAEGVAPAK